MRSHLHQQVNRKVSHFILGEEGKVGSQSAFAAATFIGATSFAGVFISTPNVDADWWCSNFQCTDDQQCCLCWDAAANAGFNDCVQDTYNCASGDFDPGPGLSCWGN